MRNLSISKKLIAGFGIVLVLMVLAMAFALFSIGIIGGQVKQYSEHTLPENDSVWFIRRSIVSTQRYLARAFMERTPSTINSLIDFAQQESALALQELDAYAEQQQNEEYEDEINELKAMLQETEAAKDRIGELLKNTKASNREKISMREEATSLFLEQYIPKIDEAEAMLNQLSQTAMHMVQQQAVEAAQAQQTAWAVLIGCAVVSVGLAVFISRAVRNSIMKPVAEIIHVYEQMSKGNMQAQIHYNSRDELGKMAELIQKTNAMQTEILTDLIEKLIKISQGDLQIRVDMDYPGDFSLLKQTIEQTVFALNDTLQIINVAAAQVNAGASQVASGAQALASGASEQAASLEELSTAAAKVAEQAEKNSSTVQTATDFVKQAETGVDAGNEHMQQLTEAMEHIDQSSRKIANITKAIDDIAFQTNILALNAAIEAARAGSAGKGFAVVADEVRTLAAKSAEAAQQTSQLLQDSVSAVAQGTRIAQETAELLKEVAKQAESATENITLIEESSKEQSAAIEQMKLGLAQVSSVVQTNAATAEENSATSEQMSAQAAMLSEEVAKFKLSTQERVLQEHTLQVEDTGEPDTKQEEADLNLGKY